MGLSCIFPDIDECESPGVCTNGDCVNYAGGYECSCDPGFEASSDMRHCVGKYFEVTLLEIHLPQMFECFPQECG